MNKRELAFIELEMCFNKLVGMYESNLSDKCKRYNSKTLRWELSLEATHILNRSQEISKIVENDQLKDSVKRYSIFLSYYRDSDNDKIFDVSNTFYKKSVELLNLFHIVNAHPESAMKRAKQLWKPKLVKKVETRYDETKNNIIKTEA